MKIYPAYEKVCGEVDALIGVLRTLLPNVNGPIGSVRKLYHYFSSTLLHVKFSLYTGGSGGIRLL
jgi:hypothetical protein